MGWTVNEASGQLTRCYNDLIVKVRNSAGLTGSMASPLVRSGQNNSEGREDKVSDRLHLGV